MAENLNPDLVPMPGRRTAVPGGPATEGDSAERRRGMLEAVATGGQRGLEAFKTAEKAINELRSQAVQRAAQRASLIGGPESQGFEAIPELQFGNRLAQLTRQRTTFEEDMSRLGSAGGGYLKELSELPQQAYEQSASASRAKSSREGADDFLKRALGMAEMEEINAAKDLDLAGRNLAGAESTYQQGMSAAGDQAKAAKQFVSKAIANFNYEKNRLQREGKWDAANQRPTAEGEKDFRFQAAQKQISDAYQQQAGVQAGAGLRALGTARKAKTQAEQRYSELTPENRASRARALAIAQGIDPALVLGTIGEEDIPTARRTSAPKTDKDLASRARLNMSDLDEVRKDSDYQSFRRNLEGILSQGLTFEELDQALKDPNGTYGLFTKDGKLKQRTYRTILAEFGDLFPTITEMNRITRYEEG